MYEWGGAHTCNDKANPSGPTQPRSMSNLCFDEGGFRIPKRHPEEAKRRKLAEVSEAKAQYKALGLTRREAFEQGFAGPPRGSKGNSMQPSPLMDSGLA